VAGVLRLREHAGSQRGGACSDRKSRATFLIRTCSHDRRTLPAFYTQAVHFPWERVAEEPALFTRRMFVRLSQLPSIRVLAQPMRSAEILVSPLPQQVQLVNPENSYLRRLERSDSKTRRISSIGRWAQGKVRAVGTNRRFCGDRFHNVICIGVPMPILFVETSRRVRRLQIPTTPVIAHRLRLRLS